MVMAVSIPRYTVDDLDAFPKDGNRYELLAGMLLVTPAPTAAHQIVVNRLQWRISVALEAPGYAHVVGPGAVSLPPTTQLQPDILVYPARFAAGLDWAEVTERWLAVEVVSPSSRVYDNEFKRDAYLALGVQHVWIVDARDKRVDVCTMRGAGTTVDDVLRWEVPEVDVRVVIDLGEVFAGLE